MDSLYTLMHRRGLTPSQRHFSSYWCDRAPNYLALGKGLSHGARIAVFRKLISKGEWFLSFRVAQMILFDRGGE